MAVLTDTERTDLHTEWMRALSDQRSSIGALSKADIRAAINATDTWIDSNAASYNSALPAQVRNALTAKQKAELFLFVARRRYEVS